MSEKLNVVLYDANYQRLASSFESGNTYLDGFLRDHRALEDWFGKTYVLLSDNNDTIIGYYNIGTGYIEQVSGWNRCKIGGSVHINCLALDKKYQGLAQAVTPDGVKINLSDFLLYDCIQRILGIREQVGFSFITLCSTKQGYSLYKRNDFEDLDNDLHFSVEDPAAHDARSEDDWCAFMYLPLDAE